MKEEIKYYNFENTVKWLNFAYFLRNEFPFNRKDLENIKTGWGMLIIPSKGIEETIKAKLGNKEEMPYYYDRVTGEKVYVKLILNLLAIINRTTGGPIFEMFTNFASRKVGEEMISKIDEVTKDTPVKGWRIDY